MRIVMLPLLLAACGSIGPGPHATSREKAIMSQAAQDQFAVVLVGDSFVELADVPIVCGKRALNAGVSGAKVADTARFAPKVIASERPQLVIINVGVNDAHHKAMTGTDDIRRDLATILAAAKSVGARVHLLGVAPITGKGISADFDAVHARAIDATLREYGGKPVPALDSDDGLHPNAVGYATWKGIIGQACT